MSTVHVLVFSMSAVGLVRVEPDSTAVCPARDAVVAAIRNLGTDLGAANGVLRWRNVGTEVRIEIRLSTPTPRRLTRRVAGPCGEHPALIALILDRAMTPVVTKMGASGRAREATRTQDSRRRARRRREISSETRLGSAMASGAGARDERALPPIPASTSMASPSALATMTSSGGTPGAISIDNDGRAPPLEDSLPYSASSTALSLGKPWPKPTPARPTPAPQHRSRIREEQGSNELDNDDDKISAQLGGDDDIERTVEGTHGTTMPRALRATAAEDDPYVLRLHVGPTVVVSGKPALGAEAATSLHFPGIPVDLSGAVGALAPTTYAWKAPEGSREVSDAISLRLTTLHVGVGPTVGSAFDDRWFVGGGLLGLASFSFGRPTGLLEPASARQVRWGAKAVAFLFIDLFPVEIRAEGAIRVLSPSKAYSAKTATAAAGFETPSNVDGQLTLGVGWSWPRKF